MANTSPTVPWTFVTSKRAAQGNAPELGRAPTLPTRTINPASPVLCKPTYRHRHYYQNYQHDFTDPFRVHKRSHTISTAALPVPAPSSALCWLTHWCMTWWVSSAREGKRQYLRSLPWLQVRLIHSRKLHSFPSYLQIHQSSLKWTGSVGT